MLITKVNAVNMISASGMNLFLVSEMTAEEEAGMDVKASNSNYNVWNDDWSE